MRDVCHWIKIDNTAAVVRVPKSQHYDIGCVLARITTPVRPPTRPPDIGTCELAA